MVCLDDDLVEDEVQIHLILIGHTGVGKTSLRKHLKNEPIDPNESSTIVMEPEFLYRESIDDLEVDESASPFKSIKDSLKSQANKVFLTMWDTGGQPIFQDLLPCFARLNCIYGIVFRLNDLQHFDEKPTIRPCKEYFTTAVSPFTSKDLVYRNLAYIQAFSQSSEKRAENLPSLPQTEQTDETAPKSFPAALVVGTYKDSVSEADIQDKKEELNNGIKDFVSKNEASVYSVSNNDSYIHEIDNTASGRNIDEGMNHLRNNLSLCAKETSMKIYRSWQVYKARLQRLCYTDCINLGIIPLDEALAIGNECKVSSPRSALTYFHELGIFIWYHLSVKESLKSFVVIDPKALLKVLAKIFCYDPNDLTFESVSLAERGMLTIEFFGHLLSSKSCRLDDKWFVDFLDEHHLSIEVTIEEEKLRFIPSILSIKPNYYENMLYRFEISSLYVVPKCHYIATGMFTRLLTVLAGITSGSLTWRIPNEYECSLQPSRNQFEFVVNDCIYVTLSEFAEYLRIDCLHYYDAEVEEKLLYSIASTLDVQLQRVVPRWLENREFNFTFACQNEICLSHLSNKIHFFSEENLLQEGNGKEMCLCTNGQSSALKDSQRR